MNHTFSSLLLAPLLGLGLVSCASTPTQSSQAIDGDFFAVVTDVKVLDADLESINKAFEVGVDKMIGKKIGQDSDHSQKASDGVSYFIGAMAKAFDGIGDGLNKSPFKFHYSLRDMDNEVVDFFGDAVLNIGDCVYVDLQRNRRDKEWVEISKVADNICENNA